MADIEDLLRDGLTDDNFNGSQGNSFQDHSDFVAIKREASPEEPLISQPYHGVIELSDSESEAGEDKQRNSDFEVPSIDAADRIVELPDSEDENEIVIKEEPGEHGWIWKRAAAAIELSDSEDDLRPQSPNLPPPERSQPIKQEKVDNYFCWKDFPKEIEISDDEIEPYTAEDFGAPAKRIKRENDHFDWMEMEDSIALSDSDKETSQPNDNPLGKSFLTKLSNRLKRKQPGSDPGSVDSLKPRLAREPREDYGAEVGSRPNSTGAEDSRSCDQVPSEPNYASQSKQSFAEVKRAYREMKRRGENTMADDVAFRKAQAMELAEIRRREIELSDEENDGGDESEDGLFIPEDQPSSPPGEIENKISKKSQQRKRNPKSRPWYSKSDIDKQLEYNVTAGLPEKLRNTLNRINNGGSDKKPKESEIMQSEHYSANTKRIAQLLQGLNPGAKRGRKAVTLNNMDSLADLNFFETTAAVHDKESLPLLTGKNKRKAMTELIASIPLEKEQATRARADKASIEHSSQVLRNCTVHEDPKEGEGSWSLKGMTCTLHHHQIQGVAKMKERENDSIITSGILADEMGLGKTVQAIALMVANPPPSGDEYRATLVVCSPAIINQWDGELEDKKLANVLPIVIRHYGKHTLSSKGASGASAAKTLETADIVLTTYSELIRSYPKYDIPDEIEGPKAKAEYWRNSWEERRGVLHRVHWYRIFLDEAQVIKNHLSFTSVAARALMGQNRWAISGTPISNTLKEFYPYFKFLQIQHTGTFKVFNKNFCGNGSDLYNQRLRAFLDHIMIRRVYTDELFGRKLVTLPKFSSDVRKIQLDSTERLFYDIFNYRFIQALNTVSKEGDSERKEMIIRRLLRLRQITSHIMMLQDEFERFYKVKDIELILAESKEAIAKGAAGSLDCINAIKALLEAKDQDSQTSASTNMGTSRTTETRKTKQPFVKKFWAGLQDMKRHRQWADLRLALLCQKCGQSPDEPLLTSCMHLYCKACLKSISDEAAGAALAKTRCLKCDIAWNGTKPITKLSQFKSRLEVDVDSESLENENLVERPRRTAQDNIKWCMLTDKVLQSSKSKAVEAQIGEWIQENPKTKIVVFSQFHLFMKVLERICFQNGWQYCTYHGEMTQDAREQALQKFRKEVDISIMIASLTCGGVGLNLTMAQRVIIVDLWFNSCLEKQAFCRVYRIGQIEETFVTRFVVEDTVDERLTAMQERKSKEIGKAIDNREVLMGMTVEQLLGLFGEVRRDSQNAPFIYVQENPIFKKLSGRVMDPDGDDSA